MDWLDLLAVQGTLKSLLQHHDSKVSILWCSAFFMVQLLHPYMTTGKAIALTILILVSKLMSLLFNMLSGFVIAFLPRNKSLNFTAAVNVHNDFGAQENKTCHCFHFFPFYLQRSHRTDWMPLILVFWTLRVKEKGMTEEETVTWHHWLNGHEFEQAPGDGEGQGSLVCCSPWDHKESDTTEELISKSWFQLVIHPAWHFTWWSNS